MTNGLTVLSQVATISACIWSTENSRSGQISCKRKQKAFGTFRCINVFGILKLVILVYQIRLCNGKGNGVTFVDCYMRTNNRLTTPPLVLQPHLSYCNPASKAPVHEHLKKTHSHAGMDLEPPNPHSRSVTKLSIKRTHTRVRTHACTHTTHIHVRAGDTSPHTADLWQARTPLSPRPTPRYVTLGLLIFLRTSLWRPRCTPLSPLLTLPLKNSRSPSLHQCFCQPLQVASLPCLKLHKSNSKKDKGK